MIAPTVIVTPLTPSAVSDPMADRAQPAVPAIQRLTEAMAAGDEAAFAEFHAAYFHRLLRYLFVVARGDDEMARDALQETFARVARHVRRFDSEKAFWGWLTLLARNAATDAARQRRRYGKLLSRFALFRRTEATSEDELDEGRLDRLLSEALGGLESLERKLIEQKYFQHARVRDLAAQFQLTEKAVESRLARARHKLRAQLIERLNDERTE